MVNTCVSSGCLGDCLLVWFNTGLQHCWRRHGLWEVDILIMIWPQDACQSISFTLYFKYYYMCQTTRRCHGEYNKRTYSRIRHVIYQQGVLNWWSASCRNFGTKCASDCIMLNLLMKKAWSYSFWQKITYSIFFWQNTTQFCSLVHTRKRKFLLLMSPDR